LLPSNQGKASTYAEISPFSAETMTQVLLSQAFKCYLLQHPTFFPFSPLALDPISCFMAIACVENERWGENIFQKMEKNAGFHVHIFARNAIALLKKLCSMAQTRPNTYRLRAHSPHAPDC
jgi:hypothetical protein